MRSDFVRWARGVATVACIVPLAACAYNPALGRDQFLLVDDAAQYRRIRENLTGVGGGASGQIEYDDFIALTGQAEHLTLRPSDDPADDRCHHHPDRERRPRRSCCSWAPASRCRRR